MLTAIRVDDWVKVFADVSIKADGPFICPSCSADVVVKKGNFVVHHFAHKPPVTCGYGMGETALHRRTKREIADSLATLFETRSEVEKRIGSIIADVYCETIDGYKFGIEVQASKLTMAGIVARSSAYFAENLPVLWVVPSDDSLDRDIASPPIYQKWIHALNYGRVYLHVCQSLIQPIHFGDYLLGKEETDWGGGYHYPSKRTRTIDRSTGIIEIGRDFRPEFSTRREVGRYFFPDMKIMRDKLDPWWR